MNTALGPVKRPQMRGSTMNRSSGSLTSTFTLLVLSSLLLVGLSPGCTTHRHHAFDYKDMVIDLVDSNGMLRKPIDRLEIGDSLSIGFHGLPPSAPIQVYLTDDRGKEWSYARLFADRRGVVEPALFWYQTGVIGTTSRQITFKPNPAFETFEEAARYFSTHSLMLTMRDGNGGVIGTRPLPVQPRKTPLLYPSNKAGILMNAFNASNDDVYVTGRNFPPGSVIHLFMVNNRYVWNVGDPLVDLRRGAETPDGHIVRLRETETSFTVKVLDRRDARTGAYDFVARLGEATSDLRVRAGDVLSYGEDTGAILYAIINGNIVIDSAGRMKSSPAYFEFSDIFETSEPVYAAVDPTDVPAVHSGGNYAAYYVVEHQPAAYWNGPNPILLDVSGGVEIQRVKYWCINGSRRLVWPNATQAEPMKGYDIIVDFGSVPANDSASFVADDRYSKGTDFIDGYEDVGFWVYENPSTIGLFPVGTVELDDPNGISGITDPTGVTGPTYNVNLAWARIMYPATSPGIGTPVSLSLSHYPIALFLHGRHKNCDFDGNGPGLEGSPGIGGTIQCSGGNRIPSHEGYNYIMERLASQGIVSISISAHDIQPDDGVWNYDARGRLVLKFLDKLRDWNNNGTDPFAGLFYGKLDLTRIGLSGHSRGGEGVVAAQELNQTWPSPHSIVAVNAIAPTDQNVVSYEMTTAPYLLIIGARDGDVWNLQGYRTYDRAYPDGMTNRFHKTVMLIHGANHNYFNTVWTDTTALGSSNPWAGSKDDSISEGFAGSPIMGAASQRQAALTAVTAFFRRHLQGIEPYKDILTGRVKPSAMPNSLIFWTYQDQDRKAVDNFEQTPLDAAHNSLQGPVQAAGFTTFAEQLLNHDSSDYPSGFPTDAGFYHDTLGLKLAWAAPQTLTTTLPMGQRDVSGFTHLTIRVAKHAPGGASIGPPLNLLINIEDGSGRKGTAAARTDQFDIIPHPYFHSPLPSQSVLTGIRIPLRYFTRNNSGVDLSDIAVISIRTEGSGQAGLDDIEFGK